MFVERNLDSTANTTCPDRSSRRTRRNTASLATTNASISSGRTCGSLTADYP
jgi:hypothetical protein